MHESSKPPASAESASELVACMRRDARIADQRGERAQRDGHRRRHGTDAGREGTAP
jgi:hypothetical protein